MYVIFLKISGFKDFKYDMDMDMSEMKDMDMVDMDMVYMDMVDMDMVDMNMACLLYTSPSPRDPE